MSRRESATNLDATATRLKHSQLASAVHDLSQGSR